MQFSSVAVFYSLLWPRDLSCCYENITLQMWFRSFMIDSAFIFERVKQPSTSRSFRKVIHRVVSVSNISTVIFMHIQLLPEYLDPRVASFTGCGWLVPILLFAHRQIKLTAHSAQVISKTLLSDLFMTRKIEITNGLWGSVLLLCLFSVTFNRISLLSAN